MGAQTLLLVRDNSSLANFKAWAMPMSAWMATCGWLQTSDTGQVDWSTIGSVPSSGTYVYEVWKSNDGLADIYLKIGYGTGGGNSPQLFLNWGTSSDGTGNTRGGLGSANDIGLAPNTVSGDGASTYNCHMTGDTGRIGFIMWRDEPSAGTQMFCIQRSLNSSGVATAAYFTVLMAGQTNCPGQYTTLFSGGTLIQVGFNGGGVGSAGGMCAMLSLWNAQNTGSNYFNGSVGLCPIFPNIGKFDNPMDMALIGGFSDWADGAMVTIPASQTSYGVSHTYVAANLNHMARVWMEDHSCVTFFMRYD